MGSSQWKRYSLMNAPPRRLSALLINYQTDHANPNSNQRVLIALAGLPQTNQLTFQLRFPFLYKKYLVTNSISQTIPANHLECLHPKR